MNENGGFLHPLDIRQVLITRASYQIGESGAFVGVFDLNVCSTLHSSVSIVNVTQITHVMPYLALYKLHGIA